MSEDEPRLLAQELARLEARYEELKAAYQALLEGEHATLKQDYKSLVAEYEQLQAQAQQAPSSGAGGMRGRITLPLAGGRPEMVVRRGLTPEQLRRAREEPSLTFYRVIGGKKAEGPQYASCVCVRSQAGAWIGSGVVIAPRWVLTAGHVAIDGCSQIFLGADISDLGEGRCVDVDASRSFLHPQYRTRYEQGIPRNDVALLHLAEELGPENIVSRATAGDWQAATRIELVGFGDDRRFPESRAEGWRDRMGFGVKRCLWVEKPDLAGAQGQRDDGYDPHSEFAAGSRLQDTAKGDSGGPVYVEAGGQRRLAGVTSRGLSPRPGDSLGVYSSVPAFEGWIADTIG